jgi:tagaturonate reductase
MERLRRGGQVAGARFVISNTTEAGIVLQGAALRAWRMPRKLPGEVRGPFGRARRGLLLHVSKGGLLFLPCELIERNGGALRDAILKHLSDWNRPPPRNGWKPPASSPTRSSTASCRAVLRPRSRPPSSRS